MINEYYNLYSINMFEIIPWFIWVLLGIFIMVMIYIFNILVAKIEEENENRNGINIIKKVKK